MTSLRSTKGCGGGSSSRGSAALRLGRRRQRREPPERLLDGGAALSGEPCRCRGAGAPVVAERRREGRREAGGASSGSRPRRRVEGRLPPGAVRRAVGARRGLGHDRGEQLEGGEISTGGGGGKETAGGFHHRRAQGRLTPGRPPARAAFGVRWAASARGEPRAPGAALGGGAAGSRPRAPPACPRAERDRCAPLRGGRACRSAPRRGSPRRTRAPRRAGSAGWAPRTTAAAGWSTGARRAETPGSRAVRGRAPAPARRDRGRGWPPRSP